MQRNFTDYFEKVFENYKKTYKEYMEHTDEQMPSDETLLILALSADADTMLKDMKEWKENAK